MKTIFCITGLAIQGLAMSVQAQTGKPNIVVIMTDQQRADLCGREGFPLEVTPFVDRLAQENVVTFPLLRQQTPKRDGSPFLCLSDFIRPLSSGIPDTIGAFASSIDADMEGLYEQDPYKHLLVQTLSDRLAEAATEKMHEYVRKEAWGYAKEENLGIADLLVEKYQGIRPAVGYPSLPDQSVNFLLDELLDMKQIGISLTENGAMYPHASVCGLMFSHPASEYFSVGKIGEDQLEDYTRRRGKSIEEMRKFLAANLQ